MIQRDRRTLILSSLYRSLLICLLLLGLIIIGGTIYGAFFNKKPPANEQINVLPEIGGQTFTGIGRIRIPTADPQPGMVILFVSFIYYPEDKVFSEELVLKIRDFREIIVDYIGSFTVEDLQKQEEENIKLELLRRFNALLRLGQIETLYFSDFLII
jgi:flagellar basal body-associated protein FliL